MRIKGRERNKRVNWRIAGQLGREKDAKKTGWGREKDGLDDWTCQVVPRLIGSAILDSDKRNDPPGPERRVSVKTGRREERKATCTR